MIGLNIKTDSGTGRRRQRAVVDPYNIISPSQLERQSVSPDRVANTKLDQGESDASLNHEEESDSVNFETEGSSLEDRIGAFNNDAATPIAQFKPNGSPSFITSNTNVPYPTRRPHYRYLDLTLILILGRQHRYA